MKNPKKLKKGKLSNSGMDYQEPPAIILTRPTDSGIGLFTKNRDCNEVLISMNLTVDSLLDCAGAALDEHFKNQQSRNSNLTININNTTTASGTNSHALSDVNGDQFVLGQSKLG